MKDLTVNSRTLNRYFVLALSKKGTGKSMNECSRLKNIRKKFGYRYSTCLIYFIRIAFIYALSAPLSNAESIVDLTGHSCSQLLTGKPALENDKDLSLLLQAGYSSEVATKLLSEAPEISQIILSYLKVGNELGKPMKIFRGLCIGRRDFASNFKAVLKKNNASARRFHTLTYYSPILEYALTYAAEASPNSTMRSRVGTIVEYEMPKFLLEEIPDQGVHILEVKTRIENVPDGYPFIKRIGRIDLVKGPQYSKTRPLEVNAGPWRARDINWKSLERN